MTIAIFQITIQYLQSLLGIKMGLNNKLVTLVIAENVLKER